MHVTIKNKKNWYAGLMFVAWGGAFAAGATEYRMGTAERMGPGYFPFVLGILLAVLGAAVLLGSLGKGGEQEKVERFYWKPTLLILAGILAFALLLDSAGIVVALVALIGISSLASDELKLVESIVNMVILIFGAVAIFSWGLNLQFPIWPPFLGR